MSECRPRVKLCDLGSFFNLVLSRISKQFMLFMNIFLETYPFCVGRAVCSFCSVSFRADRAAFACLCSVNSVCQETYVCVELCGMRVVWTSSCTQGSMSFGWA